MLGEVWGNVWGDVGKVRVDVGNVEKCVEV